MVQVLSSSAELVVLDHRRESTQEHGERPAAWHTPPESMQVAPSVRRACHRSGFSTRAIRTGHQRSLEGEHSEAIYETSSYVYGSSAESEAAFSGNGAANVYSRFTNPTVRIFEERIAALERTEMAVGTASGMAALLALFMTYLKAGDHVICSQNVFGSTAVLLRKYFVDFGVDVSFVPLHEYSAWERAVRRNTKLLFCETPSNPTLVVGDIRHLAMLAGQADALLAVDNTLCTPCGQNPLTLGAELVVHSASKFIDGQGRCIGGAVAGPAVLINRLRNFMRCAGPAMTAHNAWTFLKGLETLELRMRRHSESAQGLAEWLATHPRVAQVYYTGLPDHPQHALAKRQQRYHGGVVAFRVNGDRIDAWRCIDAMRMISRTTNIGDAKTMVTHPASTSHLKLSPEQRAAAGVHDNLVRIAVGLEDLQDIIEDVDYGLTMM